MLVDIITIFPQMFQGPFAESLIKRAVDKGLVRINIHNLRDFTHDRHRTVDDSPYGGGPGMVMKPGPIFEAVETIKGEGAADVILLTPAGDRFTQQIARDLAVKGRLTFICGHYEGVDERVREGLITRELSIGDYVMTGGELAAMVVVDAVVRLIPGVLGSAESLTEESFSSGLLEYPQYTRPEAFRGQRVPEVLLSGNHEEVARWRRDQAIRRTFLKRPDLLEKTHLTEQERRLVAGLREG
ncbi:MAG: tRNA (guanosine(37)-N1)-methyltransferase TrmD [Chloroflexi bacterium]|nr:tRNA (guanosine(37)-N1)-methyltransferase TrmD [Chloroflexota bacterium]MBI4288344.1 tRNA (guanosine(37)-N1)-methyltransferase TrmD [Chloroflexota bacterium]